MNGDVTYRLIPGTTLPKRAGPVIAIEGGEHEGETYGPGCIFWCPCLRRRIVVRTPPHEFIKFDSSGRPTIRASLGARPEPPDYPDANWCHAYMTGGQFSLLADSVCPGTGKDHADV